jgi:hypothetical protein
MFKWTNTSHILPMLIAFDDIAVSTNVPPHAQQPGFGTCATDGPHCLDTLDGRFQSQGTQAGMPAFGTPVRLWQTRTNGDGGFPIPHAYRINADTLTIDENCAFYLSGTSFDFNPSIVANLAGTSFVTWSATDPPNNINAQVRMSGKLLGDVCGSSMRHGILVNQSTNSLTGNLNKTRTVQRWGDTSAITLDPRDVTTAYGVNEKVFPGDSTKWRSYIFNAHLP